MDEKFVDEEKLFEAVTIMSDSTIEMYNQFRQESEKFNERCKNYLGLLENEAKIKPGSDTSATLKDYSKMMQVRYDKNHEHLECLHGKIDKLDTSKKDLINKLNAKEKEITEKTQKISDLEKRRNSLQSKRDQVEALKLLTNIDFCFEDETVSGFVADKNTKKISCFDIDPQKFSQKQITDKLYEIMFDVSSKNKKLSE